MTLKGRLIALVAGALLISLAVGGTLIVAAASHWVQSEIDTDAMMARQLVEARIAEEAEEAESPGRITDLMESLEATHHLRARYLRDGDHPPPVDDDDRAGSGSAPAWLAPLLGVRATVQDIPVAAGRGAGGTIEIVTDPAAEISKVWRLIKAALTAIVVVSASTLVLVAVGLTSSLRPLGELAGAFTRIGNGDYATRVGAAGPTEIAQLGRHFDHMAEQLQTMQKRTRTLTAQLLAIQERERREIARDLHDELGPCLLAANLDVSALIRLNRGERRGAVEECARSLGGVLERMQRLVRGMIGRLHLDSAEPFDLATATQGLVDFWRERCPEIALIVSPWEGWPAIPPEAALALSRIAQEAVSNAVRHSGAGAIAIDCVRDGADIVLSIRDDGTGIPPDAGTGYGLSGMRERIEALGGALTIETGSGRGTRIAARLSISQDAMASERVAA